MTKGRILALAALAGLIYWVFRNKKTEAQPPARPANYYTPFASAWADEEYKRVDAIMAEMGFPSPPLSFNQASLDYATRLNQAQTVAELIAIENEYLDDPLMAPENQAYLGILESIVLGRIGG